MRAQVGQRSRTGIQRRRTSRGLYQVPLDHAHGNGHAGASRSRATVAGAGNRIVPGDRCDIRLPVIHTLPPRTKRSIDLYPAHGPGIADASRPARFRHVGSGNRLDHRAGCRRIRDHPARQNRAKPFLGRADSHSGGHVTPRHGGVSCHNHPVHSNHRFPSCEKSAVVSFADGGAVRTVLALALFLLWFSLSQLVLRKIGRPAVLLAGTGLSLAVSENLLRPASGNTARNRCRHIRTAPTKHGSFFDHHLASRSASGTAVGVSVRVLRRPRGG